MQGHAGAGSKQHTQRRPGGLATARTFQACLLEELAQLRHRAHKLGRVGGRGVQKTCRWPQYQHSQSIVAKVHPKHALKEVHNTAIGIAAGTACAGQPLQQVKKQERPIEHTSAHTASEHNSKHGGRAHRSPLLAARRSLRPGPRDAPVQRLSSGLAAGSGGPPRCCPAPSADPTQIEECGGTGWHRITAR